MRAAPAARDIPHRPPLNWKRSSKGDRFCLGPFHGIRTRKGAELRKREAFSSAAREERSDEADAGGASRTRHPSSPTIELETVLERGPFLFGPISWDSNPQGCGAEETRSVFQRSTRGAERRSGARAAPAARGHPSSPTTELLGLRRWRPFLFQAQRMGFEPASTSVTKAVVKKWQK